MCRGPGVAGSPTLSLCDGHGPASSQRGLTADAPCCQGGKPVVTFRASVSVNNRFLRLLKCCIQPEGATGRQRPSVYSGGAAAGARGAEGEGVPLRAAAREPSAVNAEAAAGRGWEPRRA